MKRKTYYEKRGRRYYPVAEEDTYGAMTEGYYLVCCKPGRRGWRRLLKPDGAAVLAVLREHEDALTAAINEASTIRPAGPLTGLELKAWQAYQAIAGKDASITLTIPTPFHILEALEAAILKEAKK